LQEYLNHEFDVDDPDLISVIDELPLWSAQFGLQLLDTVILKKGMKVLDIGCGLGFPLIELSQRLGPSCKVYGLDPWKAAADRIGLKVKTLAIDNVEIYTGCAEAMPFEDCYFDLLVSNNGINNVQSMTESLSECRRVSRQGAQFVQTFNLPETMIEFYSILKSVLERHGRTDAIERMNEHIRSKRRPLADMESMLTACGFEIEAVRHDSFELCFLDATTMFNHYLIKYWFLPNWKEVIDQHDWESVFSATETALDAVALREGKVTLTIPFVTLDCRRQ
jgi:ubiquinone/menaquinone biosynthesis C-methylase UbiE